MLRPRWQQLDHSFFCHSRNQFKSASMGDNQQASAGIGITIKSSGLRKQNVSQQAGGRIPVPSSETTFGLKRQVEPSSGCFETETGSGFCMVCSNKGRTGKYLGVVATLARAWVEPASTVWRRWLRLKCRSYFFAVPNWTAPSCEIVTSPSGRGRPLRAG